MQANANVIGNLIQLSPFFVFVGLFIISVMFFSAQLSPLFAALMAIIFSFFTFRKKLSLNQKIGIFLQGAAQPTILAMVFIFIFSGVFTYVLKLIGSVDTAINLGLCLIPQQFLLPGFFAIIGLFAIAIGSSMGTIAAFVPIAVGIASKLNISPALLAGITVSGAMLGDNLSIISDTTIAATQTTGSSMTDKLKANIKLVIPAFLATIGILGFINYRLGISYAIEAATCTALDLVKIVPYFLVLALTALGLDVIGVLVVGIFTAAAIGIYIGHLNFLTATGVILDGFVASCGLQEVLILVLFIGGLSYIVEYNGGIAYLLEKLSRKTTNKAGAELSIIILTFLVNAAIAINTIAILITGPIAKQIGNRFGVANKRIACLLDITACICQGILPYTPQLLLAATLAGTSSIAIMPYLHYQAAIAVVLLLSVIQTYMQTKKQ